MTDNLYTEILKKLAEGETTGILTTLYRRNGNVKTDLKRCLTKVQPAKDEKGKKSLNVQCKSVENSGFMILEPITPKERLLVFGGGHIALPLCEFASKCGFAVTVVDDRPAFANKERFPFAEEIIMDDFVDAIHKLKITSYDYVVVVTRGHAHDADCLRALLSGQEPYYLGMIGSRKRVRAQFELLISEGFLQERIERIYTPIGLNIGAVTPSEIAVAILGEVIACKRQGSRNSDDKNICSNQSDLEVEILNVLAAYDKPAALVTLIETEGSTPRKAGAKMLVKPDSTIIGTIGGGLSEGLSIQAAVQIIGSGEYKILDFDLSGSVAETDGMVCGGRSCVLIEDLMTKDRYH